MLDPFTYWTRVMASWQTVADTGQKLMETASASHAVIAARTGILQSAARSPLGADYPELFRMVPEKVAAFSAAGDVVMDAWSKAQMDCLNFAARTAARSTSGQLSTPMDLVSFWTAASADMLGILEGGSRLGRDTLAPIHKTATSNAKRLATRKRLRRKA